MLHMGLVSRSFHLVMETSAEMARKFKEVLSMKCGRNSVEINKKQISRCQASLSLAAILFLLIWLVGCGSGELTDSVPSPDNAHIAEVFLDRGNAIQRPWEFVFIRKMHPTLADTILGRTKENVFVNQSYGYIKLQWTNSRELLVVCEKCSEDEIHQPVGHWDGVVISHMASPQKKKL